MLLGIGATQKTEANHGLAELRSRIHTGDTPDETR